MASTQRLDFTRITTWLANCFSLIKKPKYNFSLNLCSGNQSVIACIHIFDTIATSLSKMNRKIQSKRVLGLMKYTHQLADHNKVTHFFLETAHQKSKSVLILSTISRHNTIFRHNQKTDTTAQVYCTLSTYVIPKLFPTRTKKLTQHHNCIVL